MNNERMLGLAVLVLGLATFFVLIPVGIVTPSNIRTLALSPDFWPKIVAAIFSLMGLMMIIKPAPAITAENSVEKESFVQRLPRLTVVLGSLFGFYFLEPFLGMVVPGMVLIFGLMAFAGERRWGLMLCVAVTVPTLLYCFFSFVASIPIPLGIFESIRG